MNTGTPEASLQTPLRKSAFLAVLGPGLVVMLADTEVGSVITAAQSGALWGYRLLLLQIVLIPLLYLVQELTVRLGIFTGKGHGELIRETLGPFWAYVSVTGLSVASAGALLSEFSGLAGVSELYGLPRFVGVLLGAAALMTIVVTGSYRRVERIALILGLFELVFFGIAWASHPDPAAMAAGLGQVPFADRGYLLLVAANIGAVIMPWMVFYQQSAVADKGLRPEDYRHARWDTAIGSLITQMVMAAVLVATAATIGSGKTSVSLDTVQQLSEAITPFLGDFWGKTVFSLGIVGAGMVAAIVATLATAWGWGEVTGFRHSLEYHPREAPWFYGTYAAVLLGGTLAVVFIPDLVSLNIGVEVMNALLLPLVIGFLIVLGVRALPEGHRLQGGYLWVVAVVAAVSSGLGIYSAITSLTGL